MNSADFIAKALSIARDYKTSYIWGGLGSPSTDASLTRAANAYAKNTEKGWIAGIAPEPTAAPPIRP